MIAFREILSSFRVRIVLWFTAVLLVTLLLFRIVSIPVIRGSLYDELDESLRAEAAWTGNLIRSYRERGIPEDEIRSEIADRSGLSPRKEFIEILDRDGGLYFLSENLGSDHLSLLVPTVFGEPVTIEHFRGHGVRLFALRTRNEIIYVGYPLTDIEAAVDEIMSSFLYLVPLALVMALGGGLLLLRRFMQPIAAVDQYAHDLVHTPFDRELQAPTDRKDEIGRLTQRFHEIVGAMRASTRRALSFSSLASHELRTPLAVLRSQLEEALFDDPSDPERARAALASTYDEVLRLSRIVDDLLTLGTLEAQTLPLAREPVELGALVRDFGAEARPLCEARDIGFSCVVDGDAHLEIDPARVRQALFNLLDNAVKHTPAGGRVRLMGRLENGSAVIELDDNGEGIPTDSLPRVFDFFYRGRSGMADGRIGTGLGLPLVKGIAEAHGGSVSVASRAGEGTKVTLRLPVEP